MLKLKSLYHYILRDLFIMMSGPVEYLYTFQNSRTKTVTIRPFDPRVKKLGLELKKELVKTLGIETIHFFGSAALEIAGQKDVDIFVEVSKVNFERYEKMISKLYGKPAKVLPELIEWHFDRHDTAVQVVLIDAKSYLLGLQKVTFRELSKEHNRKEYEKLKNTSDGVTVFEYEKRRLAFFNKILKKRFGKIFV